MVNIMVSIMVKIMKMIQLNSFIILLVIQHIVKKKNNYYLNNFRMKVFGRDKIPEIVYNIFNKKFQYPSLKEGFHEIVEVVFKPELRLVFALHLIVFLIFVRSGY